MKQLKMGLNALKCIQMYISPKGQKIAKHCKKWLKIANNFKISQVTKYCEKMINM